MTISNFVCNMIRKQLPILMSQAIASAQPMTFPIQRITMKFMLTPKSKYKFSRDWYVAEFNVKDFTDVVHWCREQFGPHPRHPDAWSRWKHTYENKIHFRDEQDYMWFLLRWS